MSAGQHSQIIELNINDEMTPLPLSNPPCPLPPSGQVSSRIIESNIKDEMKHRPANSANHGGSSSSLYGDETDDKAHGSHAQRGAVSDSASSCRQRAVRWQMGPCLGKGAFAEVYQVSVSERQSAVSQRQSKRQRDGPTEIGVCLGNGTWLRYIT